MQFQDSLCSLQTTAFSSIPHSPTILLLGTTAVGKSTLYERLCGLPSEFTFGLHRPSLGFRQASSEPDPTLTVIDTPTILDPNDSPEAVYKAHLADFARFLEGKQIHRIFVLAKFGSQQDLESQIRLPTQVFQSYHSFVTLLVTHWDLSDNPQYDSKLIQQTAEKFRIANFIMADLQRVEVELLRSTLLRHSSPLPLTLHSVLTAFGELSGEQLKSQKKQIKFIKKLEQQLQEAEQKKVQQLASDTKNSQEDVFYDIEDFSMESKPNLTKKPLFNKFCSIQ